MSSDGTVMNTVKRGLYEQKGNWRTVPLIEVPKLMAEAIDESTGYYVALEYQTESALSTHILEILANPDVRKRNVEEYPDMRKNTPHTVVRNLMVLPTLLQEQNERFLPRELG